MAESHLSSLWQVRQDPHQPPESPGAGDSARGDCDGAERLHQDGPHQVRHPQHGPTLPVPAPPSMDMGGAASQCTGCLPHCCLSHPQHADEVIALGCEFVLGFV